MKEDSEILILEILAENLKKLRKAQKLSLRKMAADCNIDHSDIAKIEKAQINITLLTLQELAKALNTTPEKLLVR